MDQRYKTFEVPLVFFLITRKRISDLLCAQCSHVDTPLVILEGKVKFEKKGQK